MAGELVIFVADAGSVSKNNFHWVSSRNTTVSSTDPKDLAEKITHELNQDNRVALGYESPLFVPCPSDHHSLGCARDGECEKPIGNRPFTAGAGAAVLATGIQSLAWVLREVKKLGTSAATSTRWSDFRSGRCQLFVWEALVSGSEKAYPPSHSGDASLAISAFQKVSENQDNPTRVRCQSAFSLAGSAIIWAGLSVDDGLLAEPCVVLRPIFSEDESQGRLTGYKLRQTEAKRARAKAKKNDGDE